MPAGRPSEYDFDLCVAICEEVADGANVKTVLTSKPEYPTFPTWCRWKREHDELFNLYMRSIQDKAESVDEEIDHILQEVRAGEVAAPEGRLLIDTLRWKAAKYYPKMFGDKVDVTTQGEKVNAGPALNITLPDGTSLKDFKMDP